MKNPRSRARPRARAVPAAAPVALTGTPVENRLTELWSILDFAQPGLLGSRGALPASCRRPVERRRDAAAAAASPRWCGPFLLRRRKADPGIAAELPPKTEIDAARAADAEQAALVRGGRRARRSRADRRAPTGIAAARPRARAAHAASSRSATTRRTSSAGRPAARDAPGKLDAARRAARAVLAPRAARRSSSPSTSRWRALLERHLARRAGVALPVPARRDAGDASATQMVDRVPGRGGAGLPAVAQGRRHRPQPHPRRPRHPLRPLVEPRRRGPGHRPGLPDRADPPGAGAPLRHRGDHRGADSRAAHPEALAGRLRARLAARPRSPSWANDELRDLVELRT